MKFKVFICILICFSQYEWVRGTQITITDNDLKDGNTYFWTSNNTYLLKGLVFLEKGGTLHIEAGTVIQAKKNDGKDVSALIICRGAQIFAEGKRTTPILFTSEIDDPNNPTDMSIDDCGFWGGLVILGGAMVENDQDLKPHNIFKLDDPRLEYGPSKENSKQQFLEQNSGVLNFVCIRHAGAEILPDEKMNALTLAGVGEQTRISHIEVMASFGNGYCLFGGSVNLSFLVSAYNKEAGVDIDQNWIGNGQYWYIPMNSINSGNIAIIHNSIEILGSPLTQLPNIYNLTIIGRGEDSNQTGLLVNGPGSITYANSIFSEVGQGIELARGASSVYVVNEKSRFLNNILFETESLIRPTKEDLTGQVNTKFESDQNLKTNPLFSKVMNDQVSLDPRLQKTSPAFMDLADIPKNFEQTNFKGAFGGVCDDYWIRGWTCLEEYSLIDDQFSEDCNLNRITDEDLNSNSKVEWLRGNDYLIDGIVVLESGGELNIQPGTTVKFKAVPTDEQYTTSALIVAKGAKVFIRGVESSPVIFTSEFDDLTLSERGAWGGLIILGDAPINSPDPLRTEAKLIEHNISNFIIPDIDTNGVFGGSNQMDNSGVIEYLSIQYPGNQASNFNAGLILAGVGSKTRLHQVEVFGSASNGIQWIGGNCNASNALVAFSEGYSFYTSYGANFLGQYFFSIGSSEGAAYHSGGTSPEGIPPFTIPVISNATFIGNGPSSSANQPLLKFEKAGAGRYNNCIFCEANAGISVELKFSEPINSNTQFNIGNIFVRNSTFGGGTLFVPSVTFRINSPDCIVGDFCNTQLNTAREAAKISFNLSNNVFSTTCPINLISRQDNNTLDPRPSTDQVPQFEGQYQESHFELVNFRGAFSRESNKFWAKWTHFAQKGYLARNLSN